jgi:hypothetical protein
MAEQHQRSLALLAQEDLDAVDGDGTRGGHRYFRLDCRFLLIR